MFTWGDQAPGRRRFGFHARPTQGGGHFILKTLPFPFPAFHSGKDNSMLCQTLPSVRSQNDFKLWAVIVGWRKTGFMECDSFYCWFILDCLNSTHPMSLERNEVWLGGTRQQKKRVFYGGWPLGEGGFSPSNMILWCSKHISFYSDHDYRSNSNWKIARRDIQISTPK